jgi:hypothetical protein
MAPPVIALARLVRDDAERPQPGPLALLGPPGALDRVAARLLAGGGDRRALAPLGRADRALLASCSAVVACNLPLDEARRVAHAKRPTLLLVPFGQDRYVYGSLPRVGAENALPALPDGAPDLDGMIARLAVVLGEDGPALAARLPALRPYVREHQLGAAASRAATVALFGRRHRSASPALTVLQARHALASARAHGLDEDSRERAAEVAAVVGAGVLLRRAGRRASVVSPRLGAAAVAYAGTLAIGRVLDRRHGAPRPSDPPPAGPS